MIEEIMRHLIVGWEGFVALMVRAEGEGIALPPDLVEKLAKAHKAIGEVLDRQRQRRK